MNNDLISIVLTLYNKAPYIEETLFSIYKQTYTNRELIIVDDCSTDGSFEIAKSFCEKLWITEKCKFIQNEKNLRVAKTFERGLQETKGEYISMQDWDDILMKNKLEENLKYCQENHVHFCYSDMVTIDENNNVLIVSAMQVFSSNMKKNKFSDVIYRGYAVWTSIFFSKTIGDQLKKDGFYPKLYQDHRIVIYTSFKWYKIGYIDKKLAYYRRCPSCITWWIFDPKTWKTNEDCLEERTKILKEEKETIDYILCKKIYTTQEQEKWLSQHQSIHQILIDFLESNRWFMDSKILKYFFLVREWKYYYRILIISLRKFIYELSKKLKG